jgi:hypothetical protein
MPVSDQTVSRAECRGIGHAIGSMGELRVLGEMRFLRNDQTGNGRTTAVYRNECIAY